MKTITTVFLTAAVALCFIGCAAPANNAPVNTNTNTARIPPANAAPTADALMALDKQANEAYSKGDSKFFETFLSDKFAMLGHDGKHYDKAGAVKEIAGVKCDVKSMDLAEPVMAKIDNDTYVLSYKATWDGTCTENGKSMKIPSPIRAASVFVRNGDKWMGAWHGETKIMAPKPAKEDAKAMTDDNAKKPAEMKKGEPKKEDAAKPEAKKDDKAGTSNSMAKNEKPAASDTATSATDADRKMTADANTEALMKIHSQGWDAWKARDAKRLSDISAADVSFVDPAGMWYGTKDAVIKAWTEPKCDIKSVNLSDGFATALSPTVELLFSKGTATGTCENEKLGALWGSAVYVKEGNDWKLAFLFETPAM